MSLLSFNRRRLKEIDKRFPTSINTVAATLLFGSKFPPPSSDNENNSASEPKIPRTNVYGAFPDCTLSKLNENGPDHASLFKRRIADFAGRAIQTGC